MPEPWKSTALYRQSYSICLFQYLCHILITIPNEKTMSSVTEVLLQCQNQNAMKQAHMTHQAQNKDGLSSNKNQLL